MRTFIKKITHPFLKFGLRLYYWKPRKYCYDGICVKIHSDVFPPHLTFSTKILLDFVNDMDLQNKTFLELGCGSGIISLLASKKGAVVTASDINQIALDFLNINASHNKLIVKAIYSDVFENLEKENFDYIVINPPYYPKNPKNIRQQAWFCGEGFEYFEKLFLELPHQLQNKTQCFMILSQDCDLEKIKAIALKNAVALNVVFEKKDRVETNYIFSVSSL